MNLYLIAFDPMRSDSRRLHEVITSSKNVNGWWHWLDSVYIVASKEKRDTIQGELTERWSPRNSWIITETSIDKINGMLPEKAWPWLKKKRVVRVVKKKTNSKGC